MPNCPWPGLLGDHEVPGFNDGNAKVGDTGSCNLCLGRYKVSGTNPCKLARRGKKPSQKPA